MSTQMTDIYTLTLRSGVKGEDFEKFVTEKGFALPQVTRAGTVERQYLLKDHDSDYPEKYTWIIEWTLHFGLDALHAIPPSLWVKELDAFCEHTSFSRLIQVSSWDQAEKALD